MTARARRVARCGGALSLLIAACCIGDTASAGIDRATLSAAPLRESLPLRFEENRGQFDAAVRFAVRTANGAILIAADGTTTLLHGGPDETSAPVRLRFAGSRGASDIFGEDRTRTISNYYVGRDASAWRSDVPSFRRVRAEDVYPGIDVIYRANGPALEYDFALMPGANPARIALDFSGADAIRIDRAGDLVVQSRDDTVIHRKPVAYQSGRGGSRAV